METKFLEKVKARYEGESAAKIERAFAFSREKLAGKTRESGESAFSHSLRIADILIDSEADTPCVVAGLLHDFIEDGHSSYDEIDKNFGSEISNISLGLSKLELIKKAYYAREDETEKLRNMMLTLGGDQRIIFVKLADRLDNLRTLQVKGEVAALKIAKSTLDLFVPLAERLGMNKLKWEMEDICFKYVYPEANNEIQEFLETSFSKSDKTIKNIESTLYKIAKEHAIEVEIQSRIKSSFSIYKKWQSKGKKRLLDILALRVIVKDVKDCYSMLGAITSEFKPVEGRIKDYIANPKENLYMSLHTTVLFEEEMPFEVQIRTRQMHNFCEYGFAAHWMYKEGRKGNAYKGNIDEFKHTLSGAKDTVDIDSVLEKVQSENKSKKIYVFSPNLNVIELEKGSITIDFAYAIHSNVGNHCQGAKVNGKLVPLSTKLQSADIVEILTSTLVKGPSRDWLKIVKSKDTASKIRYFFKKENREENIKVGKSILEEFARQNGLVLSRVLEDEQVLADIKERFHLSSVEDMFVIVGYGGLTSSQLLGRAVGNIKSEEKKKHKALSETKKSQNANVIVGGHSGLLTHFAKCCNPIYGDKIVGYVSRGAGVTIHRQSCSALERLESERIIACAWSDENEGGLYSASFSIIAKNTIGALSAISTKIADFKVDISYISSDNTKNNEDALIHVGVRVKSRKQLDDIMNRIRVLGFVYDVYR